MTSESVTAISVPELARQRFALYQQAIAGLQAQMHTRWPLQLKLGDTPLGAWLINHELGHALYRLPHTDHGVMGFRTIWPDAEEVEAARGFEG